MIARVKRDFLPVTGNTQDLQWHRSIAQKWFLSLVDSSMTQSVSTRSGSKLSGEGPKGRASRLDLNRQVCQTNDPQGIYVCGADGTPYGFTNDHDPVDLLRFLDSSLAEYRSHPPRPVQVTAAEKQASFAITPAKSTQVLQVYSRIPNVPAGCSFLNESLGRDFCWIYAEEVALLAKRIESRSSTIALPEALARRIARFHLLDNVRGTPDLWNTNDIRSLAVSAKVTERTASTGIVHFTGNFHLQNGSGKRGYTGTLAGYFHMDLPQKRLQRFRAFADGKAWGAGTYTPNPPPGKFRLVVALLDTTDPIARIVPPEEVATFNRDTRYHKP